MAAMGVKQVAVAGGEPEIAEFATHVIQELQEGSVRVMKNEERGPGWTPIGRE